MNRGGYPEIAQKDIEGAKITWRNMHVILRWLKIRTIQFSLFSFRNINHMSKTREGAFFLVRKSREGSKFEPYFFSGRKTEWFEF